MAFDSVIVYSRDDIPEWVPPPVLGEVEERRQAGRAVMIVKLNERIYLYPDGGEPEDNSFARDWSWVQGALEDAYAAGVRAGYHGAGG